MEFTIVPVKLLSCETVGYYTVKIAGQPEEYYDFMSRMLGNPENKREAKELHLLLKQIGDDVYGAEETDFKAEDEAHRLITNIPVDFEYNEDGTKNYGLRLYCYRYSNELVFLFNGDRKTRLKVLMCHQCSPYFKKANQIAVAIKNAIDSGVIIISGKKIDINDTLSI